MLEHTGNADRSESCGAARPHSWILGFLISVLLIAALSETVYAGGPPPPGMVVPMPPVYFVPSSAKKSMIEARGGYLWGVNALWLRDGDNANNVPGKREVSLESPVFGIQGETRLFSDDLGARVQGWINVPQTSLGDFLLDLGPSGRLTAYSWESDSRYLSADLAAVYHLGPFGRYPNHLGGIGMSYTAALVAGYRYINFDITSARHAVPAGTSEDHQHIHIPYLGLHYADEDFMGTLVRLDMLASPLILSRLDGQRQFRGTVTETDGQSVTGFWFETLFSWSWPVGRRGFVGLFTRYSYLELSGGATVKQVRDTVPYSTRFSLDSITNLVVVGASGVVTF